MNLPSATAGRPKGSPPGEPPAAQICAAPRRALSPRARQRLRIAAGLLRAGGVRIVDVAGFYEGVLAALDAMPPDARAHVRDQVDWAEAYCAAEVDFFGALVRK